MVLLLFIPCLIAGAGALNFATTPVTPSTTRPGPLPRPSPPISSPSPTSSSTPLLYFSNVPQLTTCKPATFNWTYSDHSVYHLILSIITNPNDSSSASDSTSTATPAVNRVISSTVDPTLKTYTWPAVDVPQGWYNLYAFIPARSFNTSSTNFFVQTGSNVSCLLSGSGSSSSSGSSSGSSPPPKPSTNIGAIIGGVLAGAVLVLAAAVILLLNRRKQLNKPGRIYTDEGKGGRGGIFHLFAPRQKKWGNLGSVDSRVEASAKDRSGSQRSGYQQHHPMSQSTIVDSVNIPTLEDDHDRSQKIFSGDEEKETDKGNNIIVCIEDGASGPRSRRQSESSSLEASIALSHGPSIPGIVFPSSSPTKTVPDSQEAGDSPDSASINPHKPRLVRKATRKPVPLYDPNTDPSPSSSSPPLSSSISETGDTSLSQLQMADDPFARPMPAALIHKGSAVSLDVFSEIGSGASSAHGHSHYMSRSNSGKDQGLVRKQSLGGLDGRPMHLLIPDMPPPLK